jgi:hypothetical protein
MSKWLRRGFGQHTVEQHSAHPDDRQQPHQQEHSQSEFPSPPRNEMPLQAAVYQQTHQSQHQNPMVGYAPPNPGPIDMDVDSSPATRLKYNSYQHPSNPATSSKPYDPSRQSNRLVD